MIEIQWSSIAEADFDAILEYLLENFGIKTVEDFYKKFEDTLDIILQNPYAFRFYKKKNIRKCVFNSRLTIYYLIENDAVFLLTLFGKQNPATLSKIIKQLKR